MDLRSTTFLETKNHFCQELAVVNCRQWADPKGWWGGYVLGTFLKCQAFFNILILSKCSKYPNGQNGITPKTPMYIQQSFIMSTYSSSPDCHVDPYRHVDQPNLEKKS